MMRSCRGLGVAKRPRPDRSKGWITMDSREGQPLVGLGYRRSLAHDIWEQKDALDCLEIIAESFFDISASRLNELHLLRKHFRLIPHGLRLSIGSQVRPPQSYLDNVARLLEL